MKRIKNQQSCNEWAVYITQALKDLKMTRKSFVEEFGIPYRTVQDWCLANGEPVPWVKDLLKARITYLIKQAATTESESSIDA